MNKYKTVTREEFEERLYNKHENNITLIGEYINISTKATFKCRVCNHEWNPIPSSLIKLKIGCPKCAGKMKLNYNYVKEYIESFGYTLISDEYINAKTKLKMICDKGHDCEISWDSFKSGCRCKICANNQPKTYEEVKNYIESFDGYKLLSKTYKKATAKLLIRCPLGHKFSMNWNSFQQGQRCSECANNIPKNINEIRKYVESFDFKLPEQEYINVKKKLKMVCPEGHNVNINFDNFQQGNRCAICSKKAKKTIPEIKEYMFKESYLLLSEEYISAHKKLLIQCPEGHIFSMAWADFQQGQRCSVCNESKGEKQLDIIFCKYNVPHDKQCTFDDLRGVGGGLLRFDSSVFWNEEKTDLRMLIEYDGIFHYEKQYDDDGFETLQIHDNLKNEYCQNNNIKLLRIPYWDFDNIEQILKNELKLQKQETQQQTAV